MSFTDNLYTESLDKNSEVQDAVLSQRWPRDAPYIYM